MILALHASLHKFLCLNPSFFSVNNKVLKNKSSSSFRLRNAKYFFGTLLKSYKLHAQLNNFEYISPEHIIDNVMIHHFTGFLNKCMLAFKRDNHLETSPFMKQKTLRLSVLVYSISRMTSFWVIIPYRTADLTILSILKCNKYVIVIFLSLRYIDTVFLGRQNHDNQINAKFEKNLVHYIEFGCLLLNE